MSASPQKLGPVAGSIEGNGQTTAVVYELGAAVDDVMSWIRAHSSTLTHNLRTYGAVLLRGLPVDTDVFRSIVSTLGGEPVPYTERSTPRHEVGEQIYTSTEYPPEQVIPMHNENSYSDSWPTTLFFFCEISATVGGGTPIADSRVVYNLIPDDVRERFRSGVIYTRSFRKGLGLTWQEAFQTDSRSEVEEYCRRHGQNFTWTSAGLRTRHRRPAWQREPFGGSMVWFNQANLFHISALDDEVQEVLRATYEEEDLPRNAFLGDGSSIESSDLDTIEAAFAEASIVLPWRPGSLLMVNNLLLAHGRESFDGPRRILVAMTN